MKLVPAAIVMILSIVAGALISQQFREKNDVVERDVAAEDAARRAEVISIAKAHALERYAEIDAKRPRDSEADDAAVKVLEDLNETFGELKTVYDETADAVALAEKIASDPTNMAERDVSIVAARMVTDPLAKARAYLDAVDPEVRALGVGELAEAARDGNAEAFELLYLLWTDPNDRVAAEAKRRIIGLPGGDKADEVARMMREHGLERLLVSALGTENDREKRDVLRALVEIDSPAAERALVELYTNASDDRTKVDAARELKAIGRTAPFDELLQSYGAQLRSPQRREATAAINNITRLGGDEAIVVLKSALDLDPKGENAGRLERSIRRLERANGDGDGNAQRRGRRGN